ncbi:hypothetical protein M2189_008236 [Bradyrhizobium japonicum]|uniref:hypothetical protein n=1 Tax=Bradyrhizobium japonicum TaxID=375 RepID=UPI002169891C|nr:hypothetical protein [Bradyrhizobium japonicum]MCS3502253.1 hypothetical protein [Bradyrhizobium japonicum]MCS3965033.1 hypothetical protein [Bradyrhizobium japonicum]MCS3997340.1 hypothetical protein [Bradyrhizobium japonicum]
MEALRHNVSELGTRTIRGQDSLVRFLPALTAAAYPFLLRAFNALVGPPGTAPATPHVFGAAAVLVLIFCIPVLGIICAARPTQAVSTRRLAYVSVAAPTVYVFLGVLQSIVGSPVPDEVVWCALWIGAAILAELGRSKDKDSAPTPTLGRWRVAHGVAGAVVLIYVLFHVGNHLFGLIGAEAHAAVMNVGRRVYRAPFVEPLLVMALFFQIGSGLYLAWRWSVAPLGFHRLVQVASGFYLSVFILGHMNSVFIYARTVQGIPTDWAFAIGGPTGLIHDPWNIRLLPHYALGVFFVLTHLASGLRVVLIAHGVSPSTANRLWSAGSAASAAIAVAIIAGMSGIRL